jgi:membrane protease YdiL (CAAX protease family)
MTTLLDLVFVGLFAIVGPVIDHVVQWPAPSRPPTPPGRGDGSECRPSRIRGGALAAALPHTRTELYWFGAVSLTAGFCEEFLYRGYRIHAPTPWLGFPGAAALSVVLFAGGHA